MFELTEEQQQIYDLIHENGHINLFEATIFIDNKPIRTRWDTAEHYNFGKGYHMSDVDENIEYVVSCYELQNIQIVPYLTDEEQIQKYGCLQNRPKSKQEEQERWEEFVNFMKDKHK